MPTWATVLSLYFLFEMTTTDLQRGPEVAICRDDGQGPRPGSAD